MLYGLRAKGTFKPGSDIDLTLVGAKLSSEDLMELQAEIYETNIPYKVDLSLFHHIDNEKLRDHIQKYGMVFYFRLS